MEYNPFSPDVQENPYPYYAYLRQYAPVYQIPNVGFWAISRYDDVAYALKNNQIFSSASFFTTTFVGDLNPAPGAPNIISCDPPVHTRLRSFVTKAFTPNRVADFETRIRQITNQLFEKMIAKGEADLITDFAVPLPIVALADMLGVEPERYDDFHRWSDVFTAGMGGTVSPDQHAAAKHDIDEMRIYFEKMIEERRTRPRNDLISALVQAQEEGQRLTAEEIVGLGSFLLVAGNETTTKLVGNTVLALLKNPGEIEKVRANPSLLPNLVEEGLRYEAPAQMAPRFTTQDVELAGTTIPAGVPVMVLFGSANHDERKFADPERFDVTRDTQGHMTFGFGIHFCVGSPLGRLEAKVALEALLPWLPTLSWREDQIKRNLSLFLMRGLERFPVAFRTRT